MGSMRVFKATFATLAVLAFAVPARAVPSTAVYVGGQVASPRAFSGSDLAAIAPQRTQAESYTAGGRPTNDSFTGPGLLDVLAAAGGIATNPAIKNDALRHVIVATGTDGYAAVISAGEVLSNFGAKPDLVAIADTLGRLPGSDGVARVTAHGDVAGGRYVSNLASLVVTSGTLQPGTGGGVSASLAVQGAVTTPTTFDLAGLKRLAAHTQTVTYAAGRTQVTDTYTGALLWDVLNAAGIVLESGIRNDILRKAVTVTGSDGYQIDIAAGEISPMFGNEQILVAYDDTAGQFATGGAGFARLVVPGDSAGGRYVSNLVSLTVFDATAVPEPSSLALLAVGLAGAGMLRQRRPKVRDTASVQPA